MWSATLLTPEATTFMLVTWDLNAVVHDTSPSLAEQHAWFLACTDECRPVVPDSVSITGSAGAGRIQADLGGTSLDVSCSTSGQRKWFTNRTWTEQRLGESWVVNGAEFWIADPVLETTGTARGTCSGSIGNAEVAGSDLLLGAAVTGHSSLSWSVAA